MRTPTRTVLVAACASLVAVAYAGEPRVVWLRPAATNAPPPLHADGDYKNRGTAERPDGWLAGVTEPTIAIHEPAGERTGAAVVICPGGGYAGQAVDKEGHYVARWLAERGVVGVVLPYRCGGAPHQHPAPRDDVWRAIQLVRSQADSLVVDPDKIGVMGFSAGGHLAATAATQWTNGDPDADDPVERVGSRPDFAVLVYPVISMRDGVTHGGSRRNLLGDTPTEAEIAALSADERVTAETPPTLLIHSVDDNAVPVENAQRFYDACRRHGVPAEMHLYETGGHGYGMWASEGSVARWPDALVSWLAARGLATPAN